jgi:hypothetical protein|uniref:Uncharacterized protein n=1 Tax=viral metagenome TaxID=1070528 RepID=A0A6C0D031_9ZZZZ
MSNNNLETLCYKNIAQSITEMPELLQETLFDHGIISLKKSIKNDIENQTVNEIYDLMPSLVFNIIEDIITSMTVNGAIRKDYYTVYANISPRILRCAINTAELTIQCLEHRYIENAFIKNKNKKNYYL